VRTKGCGILFFSDSKTDETIKLVGSSKLYEVLLKLDTPVTPFLTTEQKRIQPAIILSLHKKFQSRSMEKQLHDKHPTTFTSANRFISLQ